MKLSIIGAGYVGLVSGAAFAEFGHDVIIMDIDREKIEKLERGIIPIREPGLERLLNKNADRISYTANMEEVVREKNQQYVDEIVSVLVERHEAPKITDEMLAMPEKIQEVLAAQPGMCFGNSREMKLVTFVGGKELVGEIVNVKITKAETWILEGQKT